MITKPKPIRIRWKEVVRICRTVSIGKHKAADIFRRPGCPARILLPNCHRATYDRAEVLRELGIQEPS